MQENDFNTHILKFKCKKCSLEFITLTYYLDNWTEKVPYCPECGNNSKDEISYLGIDSSEESMPTVLNGSSEREIGSDYQKISERNLPGSLSTNTWITIVVVSIVVTLIAKHQFDRSKISLLQSEIENCIERTENGSRNVDIRDCIQEAWSWSFDWN